MNLIELAKGAGVTSKRTLTRLIDAVETLIDRDKDAGTAEGRISKNEILKALKIKSLYVSDERVPNWVLKDGKAFLEDYLSSYAFSVGRSGGTYVPKGTTELFYKALNRLSEAHVSGEGLEEAVSDFLIIYNLSQPVMKIPPLQNPPEDDKLPKGYKLNDDEVVIKDGAIRIKKP